MDDNKFLEEFYNRLILRSYDAVLGLKNIHWMAHDKVDLDAWAHYFTCDNKEYALLYEDLPDGSFFKDGLSHEVVKCGDETSIELRFSDSSLQIPNLTGWYTLFRKK